MKKWLTVMLVVLSMVVSGCGQSEEGSRAEDEDAAGNVVVLSETSRATEEMNEENEAEKESQPIQEAPEQEGQSESGEAQDEQQEQVIVAPEELTEPEITQQEVTETVPEYPDDSNLQIVFLGDSILDGYRNETGIPYLTGLHCGADVYNFAMGGTTAALTTYEKSEYEKWDSRSLQGVVHVLCGNVSSSLLEGYAAKTSYDSCNLASTDYFVIEYGMNDFLSGIPLNDLEDYYDEYTYAGALRIAVDNLRSSFPNATIVLCAPNYAQFWGKNGAFLGDGNVVNNGGGTLVQYSRICENVATDLNTLFFDAYYGMGLDAYTADEYLEDGIHLSEKGRQEYARVLSNIIMHYEETKNN